MPPSGPNTNVPSAWPRATSVRCPPADPACRWSTSPAAPTGKPHPHSRQAWLRLLPARARARRLPLRQHLRALPELPHRQHASARARRPTPGRASACGRRRGPRLDRGGRPAPPPDRPTRRRPGPSRQHMNEPTLVRVERTCAQLLQAHQQVTFTAVAQLAGIAVEGGPGDPELRAVIDEHRTRQAEARTLSGLAHEIAHLRTALEAVAENVRRHEERLRRLKRRTGRQTG